MDTLLSAGVDDGVSLEDADGVVPDTADLCKINYFRHVA